MITYIVIAMQIMWITIVIGMVVQTVTQKIKERADKNMMECQKSIFNILVDLGLAEHKMNSPRMTHLDMDLARLRRDIKELEKMRVLWFMRFL